MCSIFGIGFLEGHSMEDSDTAIGLIRRLFIEAESRGRRAAGVSIMRETDAAVIRRPLSGSDLSANEEYLGFMEENLVLEPSKSKDNRVVSVIGHCRAPTQGSPQNNYNNHPIVVGKIIGVHNGVVSNDHTLFSQYQSKIDRIAEVDSEIIFSLIDMYSNNGAKPQTASAIRETVVNLSGYFACAVQNKNHPYNLYLFRQNAPLKAKIFTRLGILIFASRESFIDSATNNWLAEEDCEEVDYLDLLDGFGVSINLYSRKMFKFSI